jgi:hypothetical protein
LPARGSHAPQEDREAESVFLFLAGGETP